jgi:hypothetical protein
MCRLRCVEICGRCRGSLDSAVLWAGLVLAFIVRLLHVVFALCVVLRAIRSACRRAGSAGLSCASVGVSLRSGWVGV